MLLRILLFACGYGCVLSALLNSGTVWAAEQLSTPTTPSHPRLDRNNLLQYRDAQGALQPIRKPSEWPYRRDQIVQGMIEVMGPMPGAGKRCPLDVRIEEDVDCGSYRRRYITYASEPGNRVPAFLLVPTNALSGSIHVPAVLCLHPTDNKVGHKVVVGLSNKSNRSYASELAERGYVTLAPAYPLLANYHPDLKSLGYKSGTMKAIWDNRRGLDLLMSLPYVRTNNGFGAIGHSLGGHNAVYTAAFDSRINVVVTSCGLDSFLDYKNGDIRGWTSTRYMPRLLDYRLEDVPFDFHEIIGALAPRTCFISAPLGDTNFKWRSVDRVARAARQVYGLFGASDRLRVEHPDCGHDFPEDLRERAYRMIDETLCKR